MSAIAFLLRLDGCPASVEEVAPILAHMRARSPDGQHIWLLDEVAFGHGRLINTPEAGAERYPCAAGSGRYQMTWDGRLDNRTDLITRLGLHDPQLLPDSPDPDLVLAAYAVWGSSCVSHLRGDFAFVIWDKEAQLAFCARDPMGARPFYYHLSSKVFAVASEDEALLALPGVSRAPSLPRIADRILTNENLPLEWERSWIEGVEILMPGTSLQVTSDGRARKETYKRWATPPVSRFADEREALEAFESVFLQAVRRRTRGLDRIALITSGGIDSASLAVAASRIRDGSSLECFSIVGDEPQSCIETRAIHSIASTLGATARTFHVPSMTGELCAEDLAEFYARPHPIDGVVPIIAMMCLAASRRGHRVLLHAVSGDLALHENQFYLLRYARERGLRAAWREAAAAKAHHTYLMGMARWRMWKGALAVDGLPPALKRHLRAMRTFWPTPAQDEEPDMAAFRRVMERVTPPSSMGTPATARLSQGKAQAEHLSVLFPQGIVRGLEGYERVAGRYGIELRDPWADEDLINFCVALPSSLKSGQGWTKYIARRWTSEALPDECVWRSDRSHLGWMLLPYDTLAMPAKPQDFEGPSWQVAWEALAESSRGDDPDQADARFMSATILNWWARLGSAV